VLKEGKPFSFPSDCEIYFHFQPLQPFGMEAGGGHTAVEGVSVFSHFNANTGRDSVTSVEPLMPLEIEIENQIRSVKVTGNVLSIKQHINISNDLHNLIQSVFLVYLRY